MTKDKISMADLMAKREVTALDIERGDVVEGEVISVGEDSFLIDLGGKTEGVLPSGEVEDPAALAVGNRVSVYVVTTHDRRGQLLLSARRAKTVNAWDELRESLEEGTNIEVKIVGFNKGGGLVEIGGLQGFLPFSHLYSRPSSDLSPADFQKALDELVGSTIEVQVLDLDREARRIIVSEKEARKKVREKKEKKVFEELSEGDEVDVEVKQILPYGLLVNLRSVEALIPVEELHWGEKQNPLSEFSIGEDLQAVVASLPGSSTGRAMLSLKRLEEDPWVVLSQFFEEGKSARGRVVKIASFGVVVELEQGVEGLIPLSEIEEQQIQIGDQIELEIKNLDAAERRLELGFIG